MDEQGNTMLESCTGKEQTLTSLIGYQQDSIVSKAVIDKKAGTITLFAFDKGQALSKHQAPYDATVFVFEGQAIITVGDKKHIVSAGQIIIMPANIPHSVKADERFKMLLVMIRS